MLPRIIFYRNKAPSALEGALFRVIITLLLFCFAMRFDTHDPSRSHDLHQLEDFLSNVQFHCSSFPLLLRFSEYMFIFS